MWPATTTDSVVGWELAEWHLVPDVRHTWGAHAALPCVTGALSATVMLLLLGEAHLYLASMGVWVLPAASPAGHATNTWGQALADLESE